MSKKRNETTSIDGLKRSYRGIKWSMLVAGIAFFVVTVIGLVSSMTWNTFSTDEKQIMNEMYGVEFSTKVEYIEYVSNCVFDDFANACEGEEVERSTAAYTGANAIVAEAEQIKEDCYDLIAYLQEDDNLENDSAISCVQKGLSSSYAWFESTIDHIISMRDIAFVVAVECALITLILFTLGLSVGKASEEIIDVVTKETTEKLEKKYAPKKEEEKKDTVLLSKDTLDAIEK